MITLLEGSCRRVAARATKPSTSPPRWGPFPTRWILALLLVAVGVTQAAEVLPSAPPNHFNDLAGVVRRETAVQLNEQLAQFERDTSTQIVVALYPRMPSASSVEDYTVRLAQRWGVGQAERKNGAVLFVFQESHDIRIVTGYGLEGALPDALCKRIIENEIAPRFRAGDFDGGLAAGIHAMMAAVRGEYRGSGRLAADGNGPDAITIGGILVFVTLLSLILGGLRARSRRSVLYGPFGRRTTWINPDPWQGGGGWRSGGSSGGTFSGGGGGFGGGGAGGKW